MKKYIFVGLTAILLMPLIVSAAWWNPFSWNKKSNTPVIETPAQYVPPVSDAMEPQVLSAEVTPQVITETKIVEKIVEKPIIQTQTITVTDPALQAQIDDLVADNNSLKTELSKSKSDLQMCQADLTTAGKESKDCTDAKKEVVSLRQELVSLPLPFQKERNAIFSNSNLTVVSAGIQADQVDAREKVATDAVNAKLNLAQAEVQLYCH